MITTVVLTATSIAVVGAAGTVIGAGLKWLNTVEFNFGKRSGGERRSSGSSSGNRDRIDGLRNRGGINEL